MNWHLHISARKVGAIGTLSAERRSLALIADNRDAAILEAIKRAHADGLEHVTVTKISEDPLGYFPTVRNRVLPWLESLPAGFRDAPSFRHMIEFAEKDRDDAAKLESDWRKAGVWREIKDGIAAADTVIAAMRARLAAILEGSANVG
ncbi:MAG: hypothetical protein O9972_39700 [Burkholderiales bacterium]|nr:hypothetical protein [Burkholderiales bacterium]